MSTQTTIPVGEPTIVMTRVYDAPREIVWQAMTDPDHVRRWWGGPGFSNPVCEMDVRPGGAWTHVMRFADGNELRMNFVFIEVEKPVRVVWQHANYGNRGSGPPTSRTTLMLEDLGNRTRWTMEARFNSIAERDEATAMGFTRPIESSSNQLVEYLRRLTQEHCQ